MPRRSSCSFSRLVRPGSVASTVAVVPEIHAGALAPALQARQPIVSICLRAFETALWIECLKDCPW
jgi:hypothetical protein